MAMSRLSKNYSSPAPALSPHRAQGYRLIINPNALATACERRHYPIIEFLLGELSGTEVEGSVCADSLSSACANHDDELFQSLLGHGVPQSAATLCQAAAAGLEGSVRMLLHNGVDVDGDDGDGDHAMHAAAFHRQLAIVTRLLNPGADVHMQSEKRGTPFQGALEGGAATAVRKWEPPAPGKSGEYPTLEFIALLPLRTPPWVFLYKVTDYSLLYERTLTDYEQIIQTLVDQGADVNTTTKEFGDALHLASFMGSVSVVRLLLDRGANINSHGGCFERALLGALVGEHPAIVELLLRKGIQVNTRLSRGTALQYACTHSTKSTVQLLLQHGADVNASGGKHGSPLAAILQPCIYRHQQRVRPEIVKVLLQCGTKALVGEEDYLAAVTNGDSGQECLKLLLEYSQGARPTEAVIIALLGKETRGHGRSALQVLLQRHGGIKITEAVLNAAADPESLGVLLHHSANIRITTAILEAAATKNGTGRELLKLLLAHDSDVPITEAVIIGSLRQYQPWRSAPFEQDGSFIRRLLDRPGGIGVNAARIQAAMCVADMKVLL